MKKKSFNLRAPFVTAALIAALIAAAGCVSTPEKPQAEIAGPTAPAAPVYQLDEFLGAAPAAVESLLGPPDLTRREGAGEYRRYALSSCALIIILYPDDTGAMQVGHVDATALTSDQEKPDLEQCLAAG